MTWYCQHCQERCENPCLVMGIEVTKMNVSGELGRNPVRMCVGVERVSCGWGIGVKKMKEEQFRRVDPDRSGSE